VIKYSWLAFTPLKYHFYTLYSTTFQFEWIVVFGLLSVRYLSAWLVVDFLPKKLKEKNLQYWFPIMDGAYVHTNEYLSLIFFSKPVNWK
jgi:hypothetical protein